MVSQALVVHSVTQDTAVFYPVLNTTPVTYTGVGESHAFSNHVQRCPVVRL